MRSTCDELVPTELVFENVLEHYLRRSSGFVVCEVNKEKTDDASELNFRREKHKRN